MEKIRKVLKLEKIDLQTILSIFIVACPILDMMSFLFRNTFGTSISPSTVIRPVIPIVVIIYLFFKQDKKFKLYSLLTAGIYIIYAVIHLVLFQTVKTESSYSNVVHEAQYLINYSFMILNLFIYLYAFRGNDTKRLQRSVFYAISIYVLSVFLAVFTGTSSYTYPEDKIGYKGWYESGNSISAIFILSLFICLPMIKDKKLRRLVIPILVLMGNFLTTMIGTRVGLFGFVLVIVLYLLVEIIYNLWHNKRVSKKLVIGGIVALLGIMIVVGAIGSSTIQRRKHLQQEASEIIDPITGKAAHITGDLITIKQQIDENILPEQFMTTPQKQSIGELYDIAEKMNLSHTQMRMIQLIYNICLVKNQANPLLILFGNGYMANFRELILEMEIPAFFLNFGLFGFILYFLPFLSIFGYAGCKLIQYRKQVDTQTIMIWLGSGFTFALSFFSGYTFFNSSTMMMIVVIDALLINKLEKIKRIKKEKIDS